jgi:hypothetical protein
MFNFTLAFYKIIFKKIILVKIIKKFKKNFDNYFYCSIIILTNNKLF